MSGFGPDRPDGTPDRPPQQGQPQQGPPPYGQPQYPSGPQYPSAPQDPSAQQYPSAPQYPSGPQYPSAPQYQQGYSPPRPPAPPVPREVDLTSKLMFVRAGLALLGAILTFAFGDTIRDAIREADSSLTEDEVDTAYAVSVAVAIFFGLLFGGIYVWLALQIRGGKNWARVTTFVVAGIGVAFGLFGLLGEAPALSRLIGVVVLLIDAAIIVLLAMRPSSEFFARARAAQRRY
jgi:hypothetical protein